MSGRNLSFAPLSVSFVVTAMGGKKIIFIIFAKSDATHYFGPTFTPPSEVVFQKGEYVMT